MKNYKPLIYNLIILWTIILIYKTSSYYTNFLKPQTQTTLLILATTYTILNFLHYTLSKKEITESKGTLIADLIKKYITDLIKFIKSPKTNPLPKTNPYQKTILLFIIVKAFFLPLMLNFAFSNFSSLKYNILNLSELTISIPSFNTTIFPLLIAAIFFIDTIYFAFGYTFESKHLKNKIRSTEPTLLGWIAALACYPPFNTHVTNCINWYANTDITTPNQTETFIIKISIIALLSIYLSATISLGTKCSNLTNRGITAKGAYKFVRHPAYISKNLSWWITLIPIFSWKAALSMTLWTLIYHIRATTEERHLKLDPEYQKYCKKVKYKYIPFIY